MKDCRGPHQPSLLYYSVRDNCTQDAGMKYAISVFIDSLIMVYEAQEIIWGEMGWRDDCRMNLTGWRQEQLFQGDCSLKCEEICVCELGTVKT
jgi:hypothetical protein